MNQILPAKCCGVYPGVYDFDWKCKACGTQFHQCVVPGCTNLMDNSGERCDQCKAAGAFERTLLVAVLRSEADRYDERIIEERRIGQGVWAGRSARVIAVLAKLIRRIEGSDGG